MYVHLDPRGESVQVPPWFKKQPQLVLQVGLNMAVQIPDLHVDDNGLSCTLSFNRSADVMIMLVLGGTGRLYGALVGTAVFMVAQDYLSGINPVYWQFWLGLLLVVFVFFARGGFMGAIERIRR